MDDVPYWLNILLGLLMIACWVGGAGAVIRATGEHGPWSKWLWRVAAIGFPITGFLLFAAYDGISRRGPAAAQSVGWKWITAHILVIALGIPAYVIGRNSAIVHVGLRHAPDHSQEWWYHKDEKLSPVLCVAMSGGGIRSAAFNIGVLGALHEHGLLAKTDVMSAVSGGSYALSWYLLQQYYARQSRPDRSRLPGKDVLGTMFERDGIYQRHLREHARQFQATGTVSYYVNTAFAAMFDLSAFNVLRVLSTLGNENLRNASASARTRYRESLQGTFHLVAESPFKVYNEHKVAQEGGMLARLNRVATRYARHANLSIADEVTFRDLAKVAREYKLPFPVFVTTVQVDAEDQPGTDEQHPERLWPSIFELNGWGLGSDSYGYKSWEMIPADDRFAAVQLINVAPAISGAALSPVAGGLSVRTQRLMWLGNVDLGYSVPRFNLGETGSLYLSDGGHSENLGLYPLVRRKCRNIIAIDAEHEPELVSYRFAAYRKIQKALPKDMGRTLHIEAIEKRAFDHAAPVLTGSISAKDNSGVVRQETAVYYVKLAMDSGRKYPHPIGNPALGRYFPQDPTSNQNFDELQFRAYRDLGYLIAHESDHLKKLASQLAKR